VSRRAGDTAPTRTPSAPAGSPAGAAVCTACALACADVVPGRGQCDRGDEALRLRRAEAGPHGAWIDGTATDVAAAIAAAATRLRAARRVLVTGLGGVTVEEARLACDVAETLGGAVAIATPAATADDALSLARSGSITAAWEELRDRADLVLFWFHDPSPALPRFVDRFVAPALPSGRPRSILALGSGSDVPGVSVQSFPDLPADAGPALAALLEARLLGRPVGPLPEGLAAVADVILAAIGRAACVGIVTGEDATGAGRAAVTGLLRALAPNMPAFEIPAHDGPPNAAGAEAVLAWRYGASGDVPRAAPPALTNAAAPRSAADAPLPFDASAALRGGAFDAVLALGPSVGGDAALASPSPVEVVAFDPGVGRCVGRGVQVRCRDLADTAGTIVRADGTVLALADNGTPGAAPTVGEVLHALSAALSAGPGGRR